MDFKFSLKLTANELCHRQIEALRRLVLGTARAWHGGGKRADDQFVLVGFVTGRLARQHCDGDDDGD